MDLIDPEFRALPLEQLASQPVSVIRSIGKTLAARMETEMGVRTVADLGKWPIYEKARAAVSKMVGGGDGSIMEDDPEAPSDLMPDTGRYPTEHVQYDVILIDRTLGRRNDTQDNDTDIEDSFELLDVSRQADTGFTRPALGVVLTYNQSWYTLGLTLGHLLHSVALAPGETTRIAVVDWNRQQKAGATESISEEEALSAQLSHTRAISEVMGAVASEAQTGFSQSKNFEGSYSFGSGTGVAGQMMGFFGVAGASIGNSLGYSEATSFSCTTGRREVAAEMSQNICDSTQQAANSVRNRRASIIREVSQQESETLSTRAITNFNHMHALTLQYYEVVQLYRTVVELAKVTRCVLLPMKVLDFADIDLVRRFAPILGDVALRPEIRASLLGQATLYLSVAGNKDDDAQWLRAARDASGLPLDRSSPGVWLLPQETVITGWSVVITEVWGSPAAHGTWVPDLSTVVKEIVLERSDGAVEQATVEDNSGDVGPGWTLAGTKCSASFTGIPLSSYRAMRLTCSGDPNEPFIGGPVLLELQLNVAGRAFVFKTRAILTSGRSTILATMAFREVQSDLGESAAIPHLQAHALYYSQAVWRRASSAGLFAQLESCRFQGSPLSEVIDLAPVATVGNYLAFSFHRNDDDDTQWQTFLALHPGLDIENQPRRVQSETIVPLPSGGVFAEAVLGRFNCAEKLDITRFWNWTDSPIPITAPEIAPLQAGSRAQAENLTPGQLGQPVLNIVNAPAVPDPAGIGAVLATVANGAIFRDMSNAAQTMAAATEVLKTGFTAAGHSEDVAVKYADLAASLMKANMAAGGGGSGSGSSGQTSAPPTVSNMGAKYNAAGKLDSESAQRQPGGTPAAGTNENGSQSATGEASSNGQAGSTAPGSTSRREQILGTSGETADGEGSQPAAAEFDYMIPRIVPPIAQPSVDLCWAAVIAMMLSWRDSCTYSLEEAAAKAGDTFASRLEQKQRLAFAEKQSLITRLGMQAEPFVNQPPNRLLSLLKNNGPLWMSTDEDASAAVNAHARILVGLRGNGSAKDTYLSWVDPDGAATYEETFDEFIGKFEALARAGGASLPIQAVHFPPGVMGEGGGAIAAAAGTQAVQIAGELVKELLKTATLEVQGFRDAAMVLKAYPEPHDYYSISTEKTDFSFRIGLSNLLGGSVDGVRGSFQVEWMDNMQLKAEGLGYSNQAKALRAMRFKKAISVCVSGLTAGTTIESVSVVLQLRDRGINYAVVPPRPVADIDVILKITPRLVGHPRIGTVRLKDALNPDNPVHSVGGYMILDNPDEEARAIEPFVLLV